MISTYILLFANIFVVIVVSIVYIKRLFTCKTAHCLAMKFEHNLITLILNKSGFEFTKAFSIYLLQLCKKIWYEQMFNILFFGFLSDKTRTEHLCDVMQPKMKCFSLHYNKISTRDLVINRLYNFLFGICRLKLMSEMWLN